MDPSHTKLPELDLLVIGAGAAGLWSALCAARQLERRGLSPTALRIAVFDSREKYGAKILMSGGTRCNLTHVKVTAEDYRGGNRNIVARVLRAQPEVESRRIFEEDLGLATKTEPNGKVFPADDSARSVLAAIVRGLERMQIPILGGRRCVGLDPDANGIRVLSSMAGEANETLETRARRVILATGGLSFPKSGSDGLGLSLLARLGHTVVPPVPALTPVVLRSRFHTELAGIASPVALSYFEDGALRHRCEGPMLWTHFGLSGPAALDVSGPWARARVDRPNVAREVQCNFCPEETAESLDARWLELAARHSSATLRTLRPELPRRLLDALCAEEEVDPAYPLAQTRKEDRRHAIAMLTRFPLPVVDVLGFDKAEVTSGGIPLDELDARLESRRCPGLHLAGEVIHVDGRLGGFNFQWAWSSGCVAGQSAADALLPRG